MAAARPGQELQQWQQQSCASVVQTSAAALRPGMPVEQHVAVYSRDSGNWTALGKPPPWAGRGARATPVAPGHISSPAHAWHGNSTWLPSIGGHAAAALRLCSDASLKHATIQPPPSTHRLTTKAASTRCSLLAKQSASKSLSRPASGPPAMPPPPPRQALNPQSFQLGCWSAHTTAAVGMEGHVL